MMWRESDNFARSIAIRTLEETIAALKMTRGVTELAFKEQWLTRLRHHSKIIASGWYCPPPDGITVLAAKPENVGRLAYSSLRNPNNWPSQEVIDWEEGFLMAYSCPIDRATGLAGDIAATLYFGSNSRLRHYFTHAHSVLSSLLTSIEVDESSSTLIRKADKLFAESDLASYVTSVTDSTGYNIGHTLPVLDPTTLGLTLTQQDRERCRLQRRFVNRGEAWCLRGAGQFSVEPQLRSSADASLPQLTFHYLVRVEEDRVYVNRDIDSLLLKYGLGLES